MGKSGPRIAVLSGKGGAGKTLLAVNLAAAAERAVYIDCDVEEPNGRLYFKPQSPVREEVAVRMPVFDGALCTGCRKCVDFCRFNALAFIKDGPLLFGEVCHACGGCALVCPAGAVQEREKSVGSVETGVSGGVLCRTGTLNLGEASGIPVIRRLLERAPLPQGAPVLIDCPPGSACAVIESVRDADYCVLAAEPTLFGAHNLGLVHELAVLLNKPFGAVLNKCLAGENPSEAYCREKNIPILGRVPFDLELGRLNSEAKIAVRESARFRALFSQLLETVTGEAAR